MRKVFSVAFIVFVLASADLFALTRGEIREQVRYLIGDTGVAASTGVYRWSDSVLNARINIIHKEIVEKARCLYGQYLSTPTANVAEYLLPSDLMIIDRVSFLSVVGSTVAYRKLDRTSMVGLDRDLMNWESVPVGLPRQYYQRGGYLGFYPPASATYAVANALKIDYYKRAATLDNDSDEPFDGLGYLTPYHSLIVKGVAAMCKLDDGKVAEYQIYREEYRGLMKEMSDAIRTQPDEQETLRVR